MILHHCSVYYLIPNTAIRKYQVKVWAVVPVMGVIEIYLLWISKHLVSKAESFESAIAKINIINSGNINNTVYQDIAKLAL